MSKAYAVKMPSESATKPVFGKRSVSRGRKFDAPSESIAVKVIGGKKRKAKKKFFGKAAK